MDIDEIVEKLDKLEDKVKDRKKDRWDIYAIIGGIITPVMIGIATIAVTTVQISTSDKRAIAELQSAEKIAAAQIEVAKTNSLVEQGKLVPQLMNDLLDESNPAKRSLAIKTIEESLPDIGRNVLEAAIEVDPSIENEIFGSDLRARIEFSFSTEYLGVPSERLFESDGELTMTFHSTCANLKWHVRGDCEDALRIRSVTSSTNTATKQTVDDLQFYQTITFDGFSGKIGEAYRMANDANTVVIGAYFSRSPRGSSTKIFLEKALEQVKEGEYADSFKCFYNISDDDDAFLNQGGFGDFAYTGYPIDAKLKLVSRGETIRSLQGYVASYWDYDEQVDEKYRIEFWPDKETRSEERCPLYDW